MAATIRLLSTDFDGTLVNHFAEQPVSADFIAVLGELRAQGAVWAINTGRALHHIVEGLEEFDFPVQPDFVITCERDVFQKDATGKWVDYGDWNRRCAEVHDQLYAKAQPMFDRIIHYLQTETNARFINDNTGIGVVSEDEPEMNRIVAFIDTMRHEVPDFHYQRNTMYLRFCHAAYSKGAALAELGRLLAIPREQIFAAGDHYNDLPMLDGVFAQWVACPSNSAENVKELVRKANGSGFVAEREAGDGVADGLRHFLK
ncbi:MAG: HAD-IIB family hydrolase [Chthoniobacteraceae bacterium]